MQYKILSPKSTFEFATSTTFLIIWISFLNGLFGYFFYNTLSFFIPWLLVKVYAIFLYLHILNSTTCEEYKQKLDFKISCLTTSVIVGLLFDVLIVSYLYVWIFFIIFLVSIISTFLIILIQTTFESILNGNDMINENAL